MLCLSMLSSVIRYFPNYYYVQMCLYNIEQRTSSLHSGHAFVLHTPTSVYIWCGKYSQPHEKTAANQTASILSQRPTLVSEGKEPAAFWEELGGKGPYFTPASLPLALPRLFLVSQGSGRIDVEPEDVYAQEDLANDITALLDDAVGAVSFFFVCLLNYYYFYYYHCVLATIRYTFGLVGVQLTLYARFLWSSLLYVPLFYFF